MLRVARIAGITVALLCMAAAVQASPLPTGPQAAFDKGMSAAKQQDFATAAKHFKEACDLVAKEDKAVYPHLYFNRALAESKVPYHELDAVRWFNAYLAAVPNAPNAAQVREEIEALKTKIRQTAKVLAEKSADMLAKDLGNSSIEDLLRDNYEKPATALAVSASVNQALQYMKDHKCEDGICWTAMALADADDLKDALSFLAIGIERSKGKSFGICCHTCYAIFRLKLRAGDLKGAEEYMKGEEYMSECLLKDSPYRMYAAWDLAVEYFKSGRKDDAERMYEYWRDVLQQAYPDARTRDYYYDRMAMLRYSYGDFEGARKTAALISDERYEDIVTKGKWTSGRDLKEKIEEQLKPAGVSEQYRKLAWARYLEGDTAAALRLVALMPSGKEKELAKYSELAAQCQKDNSQCEEIRRASKVALWAATDKKAAYFSCFSRELILDIAKVLDIQGKQPLTVTKDMAEMSVYIHYALVQIGRLEAETGTRAPLRTTKNFVSQ